MSTLLYFAYGSNLHPVRLGERVPSARLIGCATLRGHVLRYHKRGACGSGKCNALHTGNDAHHVLGALFEMAAAEKPQLDVYEGEGYECLNLRVQMADAAHWAFAYIALDTHIDDGLQPFAWYQALVHHGARYHDFPQVYVESFIAMRGIADPDADRHRRHIELIGRLATPPCRGHTKQEKPYPYAESGDASGK